MRDKSLGHAGALDGLPGTDSHPEAGEYGNHPPLPQCAFALQLSFGTKTIVPFSVQANAKSQAAYGVIPAEVELPTAARKIGDGLRPAMVRGCTLSTAPNVSSSIVQLLRASKATNSLRTHTAMSMADKKSTRP